MRVRHNGVKVIAHRGASAYETEHTFAAYDLALKMGADVLEIDVRLTADRQLVVVHDRTLLRTCGVGRAVGELRLAEIWELQSPLRPLGLHEIFARYGAGTSYLLDLKAPAAPVEHLVARSIDRHGLGERVTVQTFSRRGLRRMRRCDAALPLAQLYPRLTPTALIRGDLPRIASFADAIAPEAGSVDEGLVSEAHHHGLLVHPWTVNDTAQIAEVLAAGVDGLITDAPDVAQSALGVNRALAAAAEPQLRVA